MFKEKEKTYIHIYLDLKDNTIYYHSASVPCRLGQILLSFIYSDLSAVRQTPLKLKEVHPYFALWTEERIRTFFKTGREEPGITIEKMEGLQRTYKNLLESWIMGVSDAGESAIHYFQRHPFYSSATLANRTVKNENHWMLDYFLLGFEECLMCELMEVIRRHITVKICKNCGRFFLPKRSNVDYCSRVFSEDGKTCSDVGYMKTFAKTVKKDELLQAYTRAYKAHYARMTKPRKRAANMTREEFESWYKQAKEGLEAARQGKISPEAYKEWLKK